MAQLSVVGTRVAKDIEECSTTRGFDWDRDHIDLIAPSPKQKERGPEFLPVKVESMAFSATPNNSLHQPLQKPATRMASDKTALAFSRSVWFASLVAAFSAGILVENANIKSMLPFFGSQLDTASAEYLAFPTDLAAIPGQAEPTALPPQLVVYDMEKYQRVHRDLGRMGTSDLIDYVAATRRELDYTSEYLEPYHRDMLFLLNEELAQRGTQALQGRGF